MLACSTPITGFLSYAFAAVLFGETRLEGPDGLTTAGIAAFGTPAVLGGLLVLWSLVSSNTPGRRTMAALSITIGVAMLGTGLWSVLSARGDASIGGGLLVIASLPLGLAGLLSLLVERKPEQMGERRS